MLYLAEQIPALDLIGRILGAIGGFSAVIYCVYLLLTDMHEWRIIVPVLLFGLNLGMFYFVGIFVSTMDRDAYPTLFLVWWSRWVHLHALIICFMFLRIGRANGHGKGEA